MVFFDFRSNRFDWQRLDDSPFNMNCRGFGDRGRFGNWRRDRLRRLLLRRLRRGGFFFIRKVIINKLITVGSSCLILLVQSLVGAAALHARRRERV